MKYIITESKINNIIKLYLDKLDTWEWDIGDGEFHVSDGYMGETIFSYTYDENLDEGVLHVRPKIIIELKDMFGNIELKKLMEIICQWFDEKYNKNITDYELVMED